MEKPSTMQRKIYERLTELFMRSGEMPNLSDLAREIGITYMTLQQHLKALAKKGYLSFESRGRGRTPIVRILRLGIPILGSITAGSLEDRLQEPEGFLALYGGVSQDSFALRVDGESMSDLIQDSDVVILQKQQPRRSGEICAVYVEDSHTTTLKYVEWENGKGKNELVLRPHNQDFPTIKVPASEVMINGVYQGLLRGELINTFYRDVN